MAGKVNRNRDRGKAHQKNIAEQLGGLNIGTLGGEDVHLENYSIECKSMARFVGSKWYKQAQINSKHKPPLVIIHITNTRYENDLVLMSLKDLKILLNKEAK